MPPPQTGHCQFDTVRAPLFSLSLNKPRSQIVTSFVLTLSILGDDIVPVARRYRPRHPRASPIWQALHNHWDSFVRTQSVHDEHLDQTVRTFLHCGDFAPASLAGAVLTASMSSSSPSPANGVAFAPPATNDAPSRSLPILLKPSATQCPTGTLCSPCPAYCVRSSDATNPHHRTFSCCS